MAGNKLNTHLSLPSTISLEMARRWDAHLDIIDETPICCALSELQPFSLYQVRGTYLERVWDRLVRQYHPLSYWNGARLKYIAFAGTRPLAAIGWGMPVQKTEERDAWIGWNEMQAQMYLNHIAQNIRFLILPWVDVPHLASHLLGLNLEQLRHDWTALTHNKLYLCETFVDEQEFYGTCYKAAGWERVGETKGFRRSSSTSYEYHGNCKAIWMKVVDPNFRTRFECEKREPRAHKALEPEEMNELQRLFPTMITQDNQALLAPQFQTLVIELAKSYRLHFNRFPQLKNWIVYGLGLLLSERRKNVENIALALNQKVRTEQHFLRNAPWNDDAMQEQHERECWERMATEETISVAVDASGYRRWGTHAAGVGRVYLGCIGKSDMGQVGVFLGLVGETRSYLVDAELFLSKPWFHESYRERAVACGIPSERVYENEVEISLKMLQKLKPHPKVKWWLADSAFGRCQKWRASVPKEIYYLADVPKNLALGMGEEIKNGQLRLQEKKQQTVEQRVEAKDFVWQDWLKIRPDLPPLHFKIGACRVRIESTGEELWLIARRWENDAIKYSLSNAPETEPIANLFEQASRRWRIEEMFKEGKQQLGMGEYEGRSYKGWYRHMRTIMIWQAKLRDLVRELKDKDHPQWSVPLLCEQLKTAGNLLLPESTEENLEYRLEYKRKTMVAKIKKMFEMLKQFPDQTYLRDQLENIRLLIFGYDHTLSPRALIKIA